MKRYLLAAASAAALVATPAAARDHSGYFGLEVGPMWADDPDVEFPDVTDGSDDFKIKNELGVDGDLIGGWDFGMVRTEVEAGHKWVHHDKFVFDDESFDADGHTSGYSLMGNVLLDIGKDDSINFYAGGGIGYAWMHEEIQEGTDNFSLKDSGFAWQLIAGIRYPLFRYFDVGLKYRYFDAGNISDDIEGDRIRSDFKSHSLLVSLIYNFNTEPPPAPPPPPLPPPPPPPPPATQTCPDGTVILATDMCPAPPPPPPPPPPAPERG
jgi:opacity protein-like surface antigen